MILHRIDYNGGEIWVAGDVDKNSLYFANQGVNSCMDVRENSDYPFLNHRGSYDSKHWIKNKIYGQSPNLSLPNIPYVEIEENVKQLAEQWFEKDFLNRNRFYVNHEELQKGFIQGYKTASAKKYTEEEVQELVKVLNEARNIGTSVFATRKANEYLQSLQPKVVSIEVEMIQKGCCWNNPANCICEHKGENMWNNGFNGKLYDPTPVTYTKDGKTFIKVKKVNYE